MEILIARFGGDGYIRYVDENYEVLDIRTTQIAFNFSTELPDGLILWTGEVTLIVTQTFKTKCSKTYCRKDGLMHREFPLLFFASATL